MDDLLRRGAGAGSRFGDRRDGRSALSNYVDEKHLHYAAGAGFVIIGLWTLWKSVNSLAWR